MSAPRLDRFGWREAARAVEIWWVLGTSAAVAVARQVFRTPRAPLRAVRGDRQARRVLAEAASQGLVEAFMILGPTFCKLGQLIASSPGVFPRPLADACLRTLDDVHPFPAATARHIVEQDLGAPAWRLFESFDPRPLSAASIAQVHACVLADGREAVLKIQRPGIDRRMNRDLRIMYRMARLIDRTARGHLMNAPGVVEDLHQVTNEELDFELEARRQAEFRAGIGAFGDNRWVTAPQLYPELCGPRVICMERLYGVPMDRFDELRRRGVDGELVLRRGVKVWLEAALVHGPFHGDVHAGNLWVLDDGQVAFLDFGIMGKLPPDHRDAVRAAQYTAMVDGDYTRIVRAWQKVGILGDESQIGPVDEVAARLQMVMDPMLDMTIGEANLGEILRQQLELQEEYNARAARELVLVTKQLMYFERYATALAPRYNMARDLFLVQNIFPVEVRRAIAERGISFPDDRTPNVPAEDAAGTPEAG